MGHSLELLLESFLWFGMVEREREVRRACLRCEGTWNVAETNGLRKKCDIIDEIRVTLPLSINDVRVLGIDDARIM